LTVAPFKLSRQDVKFICGATLKTHPDQFSESDKTFKSIPSELIELSACEIRSGSDDNGSYSEVVVPDQFEPGSVMLFYTEMKVR
jgi:glycogen debranching enzyme